MRSGNSGYVAFCATCDREFTQERYYRWHLETSGRHNRQRAVMGQKVLSDSLQPETASANIMQPESTPSYGEMMAEAAVELIDEMATIRQEVAELIKGLHTAGLCSDVQCRPCRMAERTITRQALERFERELDEAATWAGADSELDQLVTAFNDWHRLGRPAPAERTEPDYLLIDGLKIYR